MAGYCGKLTDKDSREKCATLWSDLGMDRIAVTMPSARTCDSEDVAQAFAADIPLPTAAPPERPGPRMFLICFKQAAQLFLTGPTAASPSPSAVGLLRSAIANFLFHYKMSQQFPHEFTPYDLSQSADAVNSALAPLIDAFNRDVTAFQNYLRVVVHYEVERVNSARDRRCCVKRLFGLDKPSFFNDGIVTVRTISGQWSSVATTSQSFLNASTAPSIGALLGALPGGAGAATPAPPTVQALANVANAYQTTYAQIGRSLGITAIPRSLATASSAEIVVSLNADESAAPTYYGGGAQNGTPANISRVSQHDTSTRVRIESVKLFEISSFSAVLQRSQSRFPLIPPFVQLPYIGTIAGIPLPPAREYHGSTAILSAIVVPTAADIAYGLEFLTDQVIYGGEAGPCSYMPSAAASGVKPCQVRRAVSMKDFHSQPIKSYNKAMVRCFATDMQSPYSSIKGFTADSAGACTALSFDQLPKSE
jgi:hypothetical protein